MKQHGTMSARHHVSTAPCQQGTMSAQFAEIFFANNDHALISRGSNSRTNVHIKSFKNICFSVFASCIFFYMFTMWYKYWFMSCRLTLCRTTLNQIYYISFSSGQIVLYRRVLGQIPTGHLSTSIKI